MYLGIQIFKKREKKEAPQVFPRRFMLPNSCVDQLCELFDLGNSFNNHRTNSRIRQQHLTCCTQDFFHCSLRHSTLHPYVFEVLACWDHTSLVRMDLFGSSILLFTCLSFLFYFNQIVYRFVFAKYGYNNSLKTVF